MATSATKRSAVAAPDEADLRAKRLRRLGELLDEYGEDKNLMGDVEVVVAGGVAHRVANPLLLAQSEVFRGMLTSGFREAAQRRIQLPDMSVDCWRTLQAYLQRGEVRVESSTTAVEVGVLHRGQRDGRHRRQAHARAGRRGDRAPGERLPLFRQGRVRDVPGQHDQLPLLPHQPQPHAALMPASGTATNADPKYVHATRHFR